MKVHYGPFGKNGRMFPPKYYTDRFWLQTVPPIPVVGNTTYVGTVHFGSHLIETQAGLVLVDTPFLNNYGQLIDSIYRAGYKPDDINYVVMTHFHNDHMACANPLRYMYKAKLVFGEIELETMHRLMRETPKDSPLYIEFFEPDILVKDGQELDFGDVGMRCVHTPGHTLGCMSLFWNTKEDGQEYQIGLYCSGGVELINDQMLKMWKMPVSNRISFRTSIDKVYNEHVDVTVGNHPFHNDTIQKYWRRQAGEPGNPFIDPTEWQRNLDSMIEAYDAFMSMNDEQREEAFRINPWMEYIGYDFGWTDPPEE